MKLSQTLVTYPLLVAAAVAQDPRAPFEASWVAFPDDTSIVATGDFDADGDVDAVGWYFANSHGGAIVRTYHNDGQGNFSHVSSSATLPMLEPNSWDLRVGQLDAIAGEDWIASFAAEIITSTGLNWVAPANVVSIQLVDFDQDGLDDLAVLGGGLHLYHNGPTGFVLHQSIPVAANVELDLADLDGGGPPDLMCASRTLVECVYVNASGLTAGLTIPIALTTSERPMFTTGDIDGDQDEDIVVFIQPWNLFDPAEYLVLRRTGATTFQPEPRQLGGPATGLADIDGDGDLDGVCCGGGGPSSVYNDRASTFHLSINDGTGRFATAWKVPSLGAFRFAGCEDLDGDGDRDLIAGRSVYFNQSGFALEPQPIGDPSKVRTAHDQDGDGDPDISVTWMWRRENDGTGSGDWLTLPPVQIPNGWLQGLAIAGDFDGDGDIDLIARHNDGYVFQGLRLLRNQGGAYTDGGYAAGAGVSFTTSTQTYDDWSRNLVVDIDSDGDEDIVVNFGGISGRVWANDGTGQFTMRQALTLAQPMAALDLDLDGHIDVVTTRGIHFGAGDGTLLPVANGVSLQVDSDGQVGVADFDGDGGADIAHYVRGSNAVTVLWNNLDRSFSASTIPTPVAMTTSFSSIVRVVALDADGDGHADIAIGPTHRRDGNSTVVMFGDGNRAFLRPTLQSFELGPTFDIDGDADLDILGPYVIRSARYVIPEHGMRRQYGTGTPGLGGVIPQFGAVGPFRVGGWTELRVVGVPGGAPVVILLGASAVHWPNWPVAGATGFAEPNGIVVVVADGTPGVAGVGSVKIPLPMIPGFAGVNLYHQAFVIDPSAPSGVSQTGGLELGYR